jgi:hypothetical protein
MRIRRQILLVCLALGLPLAAVAASGAHVRAHAATTLPTIGGRQPAPSLFGLNTGTFDPSVSFKATFGLAKQHGGRWLHFTAGSIHWANGKPNYDALDFEVTQTRKRHMGVLLSLGGAASACSIPSLKSNPKHCPPKTTHDLRAYKKFLTSEVLRYRHDVTYYESWTEPNHSSTWPPKPNPGQYARLLRTQYSVFKSVNKRDHLHLKLIFGGSNEFSSTSSTPGVIAVLPFTHSVLAHLGGTRAFDAAALHAYIYPPNEPPSTTMYVNVAGIPTAAGSNGPYPNQGCDTSPWCQMNWPQELSAYEQEFQNHGYGTVPLWLTEFGWPGNAKPNGNYFPSNAVQAQNLREAYGDLKQLPFAKAAFWFNLLDYQPGLPPCTSSTPPSKLCNPDPAFFAHYGILTWQGQAKPAATVFKSLSASYR